MQLIQMIFEVLLLVAVVAGVFTGWKGGPGEGEREPDSST